MSWATFITQDVNNSISDENKHYSEKQVIEIFNKNISELNTNDVYVLKTIFTESFLQAFYNFLKETKINLSKAQEKYYFLKEKLGIKNEKFEWFFGI